MICMIFAAHRSVDSTTKGTALQALQHLVASPVPVVYPEMVCSLILHLRPLGIVTHFGGHRLPKDEPQAHSNPTIQLQPMTGRLLQCLDSFHDVSAILAMHCDSMKILQRGSNFEVPANDITQSLSP